MQAKKFQQRGQSFVEMALIMPILLLLLGGVVDLGRGFLILVAVENAGSTLLVTVTHTYTPLTPLGHLLWGDRATVEATARQEILSPPPPGYRY